MKANFAIQGQSQKLRWERTLNAQARRKTSMKTTINRQLEYKSVLRWSISVFEIRSLLLCVPHW